MVRFSDMLGGSGEPDDVHAANSPYAALASDLPPADPVPDTEPEPEPEVEPEPEPALEPMVEAEAGSALETPEDVLNRLTQYATSARAVDPVVDPVIDTVVDEAAPEPADDDAAGETDPLSPVGDRDDLLPRAKGVTRRSGRGRKRHP